MTDPSFFYQDFCHLSVPGYDGYAKVAIVPEQRRPLHLGAHPRLLLLLVLLVLVLLLALNPLGLLTVTPPANSSLTSTCTHFNSLTYSQLTVAIILRTRTQTPRTPWTRRQIPEIKRPKLKVRMLNAQLLPDKKQLQRETPHCKFWRDDCNSVFEGCFFRDPWCRLACALLRHPW